MRELVASNDDGDQAGDLRNRASEQRLHCSEAGIERRLCESNRREEDQQGQEAKAGTKPAQAARACCLQPVCGRERGNHRHLQRLW